MTSLRQHFILLSIIPRAGGAGSDVVTERGLPQVRMPERPFQNILGGTIPVIGRYLSRGSPRKWEARRPNVTLPVIEQ